MACDNLYLPYRDSLFDAVISIGVLHHLSSSERRGQALSQLARILCSGGKMMVYVWAMEQNKRKFDGQDVLIPWSMQTKKKKGKLLNGTKRSSSSLSDDESSTSTSVCSQNVAPSNGDCKPESPRILAQKRELCNDIISFVTESKNNGKFPSIFDWLNSTGDTSKSRRKSPPLLNLLGKTGTEAEISTVVANSDHNSGGSSDTNQAESPRNLARSKENCSTSLTPVPDERRRSRSPSLPDKIKAHLQNLLPGVKPELPSKLEKDALYRQLIEHIINNESHIFDQPWPPLDPSELDASTFQVRQFPLSSFPATSPLSRFQQSLDAKSQEDSSLTDGEDVSDDVFDNAQLETTLLSDNHHGHEPPKAKGKTNNPFSPKHKASKRKPALKKTGEQTSCELDIFSNNSSIDQPDVHADTTNGLAFGNSESLVNGHTENIHIKQKRPNNIALKPIIEQNSQNKSHNELLNASNQPDAASIKRHGRTSSDPTVETPSRSNGFYGNCNQGGLSPWIQDGGYSADESSLNSSFADLSCENKAVTNHHHRVRRKPRSHLESFLSKKAHSFDAQTARKSNGSPGLKAKHQRNGLKLSASLDTDSDVTASDNNDSQEVAPVYHRYYHVFKQGELVALFDKYAPDVVIVDVYFDHGNWCVVAEKV